MRSTYLSVLAAAVGSAWILVSYAAVDSRAAAAPVPARITVLYDAFGKNAAMTKDWGYAALVEIGGKRILLMPATTRGSLQTTPRPRASTSRSLTSWSCRIATATISA